jgi:Cdc6-like AAA superfamily ATPase
MAIPVLLIGKSGSGKSASLRTCVGNKHFNVINVLNKPFPFKGDINKGNTDDYDQVMKWLIQFPAESIVIDDAGYLITNMFMKGHSNAGAGNAVFSFYNKIGDHFWNLIEFIKHSVPKDKIVYVVMHEDTDDFGNHSLIDCLYYLKCHKDKQYEWKEHNIIIEEMTFEEVDRIFK